MIKNALLADLIHFIFINLLSTQIFFLIYDSQNRVNKLGQFFDLLIGIINSMIKRLDHLQEVVTNISIYVLRLIRSEILVAQFSQDCIDRLLELFILVT